MPLHSSDASASAMFASHCYDNAASLSSLHVPAPAAADSVSAPHLSVQSLPISTAHFHTRSCMLHLRLFCDHVLDKSTCMIDTDIVFN